MRLIGGTVLLALCVPLAACGGGGGGVNSTPTPAPAPAPAPTPTPTNTLISNLVATQTFASQATTTDVVVGASDGYVGTTSAKATPLTIKYDAAARTYTVETDGRSQTFGLADAQPQRWDGEKQFAKALSAGGDYLTLVTNPYSDPQYSNKYVGMGYWQRNARQGTDQQTYFATFTYGFDTPPSGVAKTGTAHWLTDVFGLLTVPNKELLVVQGLGDFVVDFAAGSFNAFANLNEATVVTQGGGANGSLRFRAGGYLISGSGFNGLVSYYGYSAPPLYGILSGSFYGPNAEEVGATFEASGGGSVLSGAFTGQRTDFGGSDSSGTIHNVSLTGPISEERLYGVASNLLWMHDNGADTFRNLIDGVGVGSGYAATLTPSGLSEAGGYQIDPAEQVNDGRANFSTYQTTLGSDPATVSIYKIGNSNSELQLTYTSFVMMTHSQSGPLDTTYFGDYAAFGIETSPELIRARTGTASYSGVAYGQGVATDSSLFDVRGTSHFDVDFSAGSYSGSLQLHGTDQGGSVLDLGQWTFGRSDGYLEGTGQIAGPGGYGGEITPDFFGPTGEEIGAAFHLEAASPTTTEPISVAGVAVAKQQ